MDGMSYFGRDFLTAQYVAAADRRAMRIAMGLTLATIALTMGAMLVLGAIGLPLPGAEALGSLPAGA